VTNLEAFLTMIGDSEGSNLAADPYRVTFGFKHTIIDLRDHPAVTGEWLGAPLDFLGPQYKGLVSTAAGRYQIVKATWLGAQGVLKLADFGPASQDAAAMLLIKERGALDYVIAGQIAAAIDLCSTEWASLPGANRGQPEHSVEDLIAWYSVAGGALA
jgi:muramidase (phage lysozyme)